MTIQEAMQSRHTVRRYTGRKIPEDICRRLRDRIEKNNEAFDLAMSLAVEDTGAFGPPPSAGSGQGGAELRHSGGAEPSRPGGGRGLLRGGRDAPGPDPGTELLVGGRDLQPQGREPEGRPGGGKNPGPHCRGLRRGSGRLSRIFENSAYLNCQIRRNKFWGLTKPPREAYPEPKFKSANR